MTAPTMPDLGERLDDILAAKKGSISPPRWDLQEGATNATHWAAEALWERWPCEDESCPARPAWDKALSERQSTLVQELDREVYELVKGRLTEFAVTFQREHPEAQMREVETSA